MNNLVPVLVVRTDQPPAVPSSIIVCAQCGHDCWLSLYSGPSTLALAMQHGTPIITCNVCAERLVAILEATQ